jgi:hypothetical protein
MAKALRLPMKFTIGPKAASLVVLALEAMEPSGDDPDTQTELAVLMRHAINLYKGGFSGVHFTYEATEEVAI